MNIKYATITAVAALGLLAGLLGSADANKSAASISAPQSVPQGSEVTITLTVTHKGNNFLHHTKWLYVKIDGNEVARWNFSGISKPESDNFSREIKYTVNAPITIEAEASCNLHGSNGKATHIIAVTTIEGGTTP